MKRILWLLISCTAYLSLLSPIQSQALLIEANQWQLISFSQVPKDNAINDVFADQNVVVWAYDNEHKHWQSWPANAKVPNSTLATLEPGQGYWVKAEQSFEVDLSSANVNIGEMILYPGWNLIGLPIENSMPYNQALASVPFLELWRYNPNNHQFEVVRKARGTDIILDQQFTDVEPGNAYWVYVAEQSNIVPQLGTLLPPDVDMEPLLDITEYGVATYWMNNFTAGDQDYDNDGYFDFPNTQETIQFGDFLNRRRMAITNEGNGVLSWNAHIEPAVDWLLFEAFDEDGNPILTNAAAGNVSDVNGELVMVVNRVGMAPSDNYFTQVVLTANGGVNRKVIDVHLAVADVVGDYEFTVKLDEVAGKAADLHNPTYFMSFARDGDGVKAFLDETRSLLIPETTYLSGSFIKDPESHFQVLGQLYLPRGHEHNPFPADIRREFTFIGQRSDGRDGLSPLDLKGVYAETLYGIQDDPVQIRGEFVARRLSPLPKKYDPLTLRAEEGDIPADETVSFEFEVTENLSITDVQALLSINHIKPEALTISVTSPANATNGAGTTVILHDNKAVDLSNQQYPAYDNPSQDMQVFNGQNAQGVWTLTIANSSDSVGQLNQWGLDIQGATVYSISGELAPNVTVQLSGCGYFEQIQTDANGRFTLDNLIPCDYELVVNEFGFASTTTNIRITGCVNDDCTAEGAYNHRLTAEQLAELAAVVATQEGQKALLVSPSSSLLQGNNAAYKTIKAVDVTDYEGLGYELVEREWQLSHIGPEVNVVQVPIMGDAVTIFIPVNVLDYENLVSTIIDVRHDNDVRQQWSITQEAASAGEYTVSLTATVKPIGGGAESTWAIEGNKAIFTYLGEQSSYIATYSNYAVAGSSAVSAIDMATFDIDRVPLGGGIGMEDSDSFQAIIDEATETNAHNKLLAGSEPGQFSFEPSGFNTPEGNLAKHYRLFVSAGQLYQGGSVYGNQYRMDVGIQSQAIDAETQQTETEAQE